MAKIKDKDSILGKKSDGLFPSGSIVKDYPSVNYTSVEGIDDTLTGIDSQIRDDMNKGKRKGPNSSRL